MESQNTNRPVKRKVVRKSPGSSAFKRGLLIYAAVVMLIVVGVWIFFYSFIDGYEKGMPYHTIEKTAKDFDSSKVEELLKDTAVTNEFEAPSIVADYVKNIIQDKEIKYQEAKENTSAKPVYELLCDDEAFAKVTLKKAGKIKHGFKKWAVDTISFEEYMPETSSITVVAPQDAVVTINGTEAGEQYIKEKDVEIEELSAVAKYLEAVPKEVKYQVDGFFEKPKVTVKDKKGKKLKVSGKKGAYTAGYVVDSGTEKEMKAYVEEVTDAYARNFANLGKQIFSYVMDNSDLSDAIELATTYFYPTEYVTRTEFASREITDFIRYTDDCFSCHVKYDYMIYFSGYSIDHDVSSVDMIWTFVKSGDQWYLTDAKYTE